MKDPERLPPKFLSMLEGVTRPYIPALTPRERDAVVDEFTPQLVADFAAIKKKNLGDGVDYDEAEALAVCHVATSFAWVLVNALAAKLQRILEAEGIGAVDRGAGD